MNFFSLDSKLYKIMTPVAEWMLLNFCWILGSLPLLTIGAASTAMYTLMGRRLRGEGSGTIVPFFKAWWSNLKVSSLFWLAQVFITLSLGMFFFLPLPGLLKAAAGILLVLVTLVLSSIYPQIARYRNRPFVYLRNAVILLVLRPHWLLLNFLVILSPLIVFLLMPMEFLRFGFIWIVMGFSVLFNLSARLMRRVLQPLEALSQ